MNEHSFVFYVHGGISHKAHFFRIRFHAFTYFSYCIVHRQYIEFYILYAYFQIADFIGINMKAL